MIFKRKKETIKKPTLKEAKEHYNFFLENIPKHMEIARQWLGKEKLNYSYKEIDSIGKHYKKLYKKTRQKGRWYDENYEVFITYCGETFIKYFKGEWRLNIEKKTFGYGNPMIFKYGPEGYHWIALDMEDWMRLIEEGDKDPLSIVYSRTVNSFKNTPEWNFDPIENLKIVLENE